MTSPSRPTTAARPLAERPHPSDGRTTDGEKKRHGTKGARRPARSVTVNLAESPLSWLRARGRVTERQFDAGEALRRDFEIAQLAPRVTMQWDAPPRSKAARGAPGALTPGERQIAAKRRFDEAMAVLGPGLSDIAWRVLCAGESLKAAETGLEWPSRSAKLVLTFALDRLASYYRLPG